MKGSIVLSEFLDELAERAENKFSGKLHQAFVDWYVQAEFGNVKWHFTDDASDGGIDAIVWRPDERPSVVLIQSKFTKHLNGSALAPIAYRKFLAAVEAFHDQGDAFDVFLRGTRDNLKSLYRRAYDQLSAMGHWAVEKRAFRLITTHKRGSRGEFDLIPKENFQYFDEIHALYAQYRKGATPRARPLRLTVRDKLCYRDPKRRVTSYLFNARAADFCRYLQDNDVARLVARNIRYDLGGRIKRSIKATYENRPHDFWYFHNGLTIVCDDFTEKNQEAVLTNPSVINGAQTLYALNSSTAQLSPALVTIRVIVRGPNHHGAAADDEWLQSVIRGVNTQNRVNADDFRSNEPEQIELQSRFRDYRVFYERKRGEWSEYRNEPRFRSFERFSMRLLGQALAAVSDANGAGVLVVKRGVDDLFGDKMYRALSPSRGAVSRRFERYYLTYRLYRFLANYGYRTTKDARRQQHGFWNALWLLYRGMTTIPHFYNQVDVRQIKEAIDRFESRGRLGVHARKVVRQLTKAVWSAWYQGRKRDPEHWTANNFFKEKYGNRQLVLRAQPKMKAALRELGRAVMSRE
jgi:hypothetical protein